MALLPYQVRLLYSVVLFIACGDEGASITRYVVYGIKPMRRRLYI